MEIRNLSYKIENKTILDDISVNFYEKSINLIIGKNGVGKTTLLNLMLENIKLNKSDQKLIHFPSIKNKIMIDLNYLVFDELTGNELINFITEIHNISFDVKKRIINDCKMLNLDFLNTRIKGLSLGQSQKLIITISLLTPCELVAFDEPFNGLDKESIKQLQQLLIKYKSEKTFILATHNYENLSYFADNLVVINQKGKAKNLTDLEVYDEEYINKEL